MSKPLSAKSFLRALQGAGVDVVEHEGWQTHNRNHMGPWGGPRGVHGVMHHHTAAYSTQAQIIELCRTGWTGGTSPLPGPLCIGVIDKSGRVHLIGYGRTNHAGKGDPAVLAAVIREDATRPAPRENTVDGNSVFYGFESINAGNGKDMWTAPQLDAMARVGYAICKAHRWNENSVIGHKEWQVGKPDPLTSMAAIRTATGALLRAKTLPPMRRLSDPVGMPDTTVGG